MGKKSGKVSQGRARQKFKAQKAGANAGPSSRAARNDYFSDDGEDEPSNVAFRGFGGAKSQPFVPQDPNVKLRYKGIAFVSAGSNTPTSREEPRVDESLIAAIELNDSEEEEEVESSDVSGLQQMDGTIEEKVIAEDTTAIVGDGAVIQQEADAAAIVSMEQEEDDVHFIVDTVGDLDVVTSTVPIANIEHILQRAGSPALSDSSEDVVLFQGRKKAIVMEDPIESTTASIKTPSHTSQSANETEPTTQSAATGFIPAPEQPFWRHGGPGNYADFLKHQSAIASGEATETIEMLQAAWKQAKSEKKSRTKTIQADQGSKISRRGKRGRKQSNRLLQLDTDSDDEEAAYQDYLDNLNAQSDGSEKEITEDVPDAMDVDMNDDKNWEDTADSEIIGQDLSDVLTSSDDLNASDQESAELERELTQAEDEILQAEQALYMRRLQGKSDEGVARLWAKQMELGIDGDELIIDDGGELDDEEFGDVAAARAGFEELMGIGGKRHASKRSKRRARQDMSFPDASALADSIEQYGNDGFDIMDYDRPSLRQTKKGRKGKLPPELDVLSDEDLRDTLIASWDKDRDKKRLKKAEREELRKQGLLGPLAKKGKADLGQKYQSGMTVEQIYRELKAFIEDDGKKSQPFPPMDIVNRKRLHGIAQSLKLKSKSVGSGDSRYPVIYKTQNTVRPSELSLSRVMNASRRGFYGNSATKGKKSKLVKRSGGVDSATVRHGEVVGAGAREIGKESFGHKLMEKMGWTKGMALGKDGEGRLVPVEQTMRVGRAGLG